jgi:hypothetical protein
MGAVRPEPSRELRAATVSLLEHHNYFWALERWNMLLGLKVITEVKHWKYLLKGPERSQPVISELVYLQRYVC